MSNHVKFDQAEGLRALLGLQPQRKPVSFFSAISANQKNALLLNLARAINSSHQSVHLLDVNQTQNGISTKSPKPQADVLHAFTRPQQAHTLSSHSDSEIHISQLTDLDFSKLHQDTAKISELLETLTALLKKQDLCLLDISYNEESLPLIRQMDLGTVVLLCNLQPDSIQSGYLQLKLLHQLPVTAEFKLLIVDGTPEQAAQLYQNFAQTARQFLQLQVSLLGHLPNDPYFLSAVQSGKSVLDAFPSSPTAKILLTIADQLTARIPAPQPGI